MDCRKMEKIKTKEKEKVRDDFLVIYKMSIINLLFY